MTLERQFSERYVRRLVSTPAGRAHLLAQVAQAEDNGEARVFDDVLARVDDPKLRKMVERHRADELRHAALFHAEVRRAGVAPRPIPPELGLLDRLDAALGGFLARPIADDEGVMRAYLVLQVIEERALDQFALFERVFRDLSPETAAVFAEVAADEERHLKYCHAISSRYAPSEGARARELERLRRLEAQAFRETQRANFEYVRAQELLPRGLPRLASYLLGALGVRFGRLPLTSFARAAGVPVLAAA